MNLRQRNFFLTKYIYNFFQNDKNKIYLFVHVNDLNTIEINSINSFLKKRSINSLNIKLNLYKKMIKNDIFINLVSGPSRIFKFSDFNSFLTFFDFVSLNKKFIPLAVYWNLNFYSYDFFYNYLKNNHNFIKKTSIINNTLVLKIVNPMMSLITIFNYNNLFLLLNILLKSKQ